MKYLIFVTEDKGHYLEYIGHIYRYALSREKEDNFIFVLNNSWKSKLGLLNLNETINISFRFVKYDANQLNRIKQSRLKMSILKKKMEEFVPDKILLLNIDTHLPNILFNLKCHPKISGILYNIPDRKDTTQSYLNRKKISLKPLLYAFSPQIEKVFLLNARDSATYYNNKFHTSKFVYLPDPIVPLPNISHKHERDSRLTFLHCGSLGERKGTISILKALLSLSDTILSDLRLIIAGEFTTKVCEDDANQAIRELIARKSIEIEYYPQFLPYETLGNLFNRTDYVLIPYSNVGQSSGILGYAAQFNKPVIAPEQGLLGNLVSANNLGITLHSVSVESIANCLSKLHKTAIPQIDGKKYTAINNPETFIQTIFSNIGSK